MGGEGEGVPGRGDGLGVAGRGDREGLGGTLPLIWMSAQVRKISARTGRRVQQSAGWLGKAAAPTMYCDAQQCKLPGTQHNAVLSGQAVQVQADTGATVIWLTWARHWLVTSILWAGARWTGAWPVNKNDIQAVGIVCVQPCHLCLPGGLAPGV
jgi:hypothetical protein